MGHSTQTLLVAIAVLAASVVLLRRLFGRKAKPGCGCNGCPKAPTRR